jgi:hypothetical protein
VALPNGGCFLDGTDHPDELVGATDLAMLVAGSP